VEAMGTNYIIMLKKLVKRHIYRSTKREVLSCERNVMTPQIRHDCFNCALDMDVVGSGKCRKISYGNFACNILLES